MSDENNMKPPTCWIPMTNPIDVGCLGKLGEECGELTTINERCKIQGIDEFDPDTGELNRKVLEDEIADVIALSLLTIQRFNLDVVRIDKRKEAKMAHKREWFRLLSERTGAK